MKLLLIVADAESGIAVIVIEPASAMARSPFSRFLNKTNHPFFIA